MCEIDYSFECEMSLDDILDIVSEKTGIKKEFITDNNTKFQPVLFARYMYYTRARKILNEGLIAIGARVNRTHSTVMNGLKAVKNDKKLQQMYESIFNEKY